MGQDRFCLVPVLFSTEPQTRLPPLSDAPTIKNRPKRPGGHWLARFAVFGTMVF